MELLELGAGIDERDDSGRTALFYATMTNGVLEAARKLVSAGANVNAVDNRDQTPLFWADGDGVVEFLLECGADPTVRDDQGWTALACSRFAGIHVRKVALLEKLVNE